MIGGILYYSVNNALTPAILPSSGTFAIAMNETNVTPQWLSLDFNIEPPMFLFNYQCLFNVAGTYNFVFTFPFEVTNVVQSWIVLNGESQFVQTNFLTSKNGSDVWASYTITNYTLKNEGTNVPSIFC